MLYLGKEPPVGWKYAPLGAGAYADREQYAFWSTRDPIDSYAARLEAAGLIAAGDLDRLKREAETLVETEARAVTSAAWPSPADAGRDVLAGEPPRVRVEPLEGESRLRINLDPDLPPVEKALAFDRKGRTFLEAVAMLLDFLGELVFEIIGEVVLGMLSPDLTSEGLAPMRSTRI